MADKTKFLADIQSASADTRFGAWRSAGEQGVDVIPELAKIAGGKDLGVRKAALEAMTTLTHSVGKDARDTKRVGVSQALGAVAPTRKAERWCPETDEQHEVVARWATHARA